jgi:hypothetical protein
MRPLWIMLSMAFVGCTSWREPWFMNGSICVKLLGERALHP